MRSRYTVLAGSTGESREAGIRFWQIPRRGRREKQVYDFGRFYRRKQRSGYTVLAGSTEESREAGIRFWQIPAEESIKNAHTLLEILLKRN